ncbi:uncharacterized protein BYT42DRAFT_615357 [Radiomyces spectabilis]|uniref:uncharacterized protein n=1 Tax=Radiomyces spectabilis TaxID=64574 RepID=UPI00221FDDDD|nr:uncharacterized protein BYT42DRAFT_615357 [Radiomyces spectabilis]KAI8374178.1 hypothetical protein BYT42DRAFT_615357 [Radiomyces spectabilis]
MPIARFFKSKSKLRKEPGRGPTKAANVDTSGFLSKPFPPLESRAKSPSDILDIAGYPRFIHTPPARDQKNGSPSSLTPSSKLSSKSNESKRVIATTLSQTPPSMLSAAVDDPPPITGPKLKPAATHPSLSPASSDKTEIERTAARHSAKQAQSIMSKKMDRPPRSPLGCGEMLAGASTDHALTGNVGSSRANDSMAYIEEVPSNGYTFEDDMVDANGQSRQWKSSDYQFLKNQTEIAKIQQQLQAFKKEREERSKREEAYRIRQQKLLVTLQQQQQQIEQLSRLLRASQPDGTSLCYSTYAKDHRNSEPLLTDIDHEDEAADLDRGYSSDRGYSDENADYDRDRGYYDGYNEHGFNDEDANSEQFYDAPMDNDYWARPSYRWAGHPYNNHPMYRKYYDEYPQYASRPIYREQWNYDLPYNYLPKRASYSGPESSGYSSDDDYDSVDDSSVPYYDPAWDSPSANNWPDGPYTRDPRSSGYSYRYGRPKYRTSSIYSEPNAYNMPFEEDDEHSTFQSTVSAAAAAARPRSILNRLQFIQKPSETQGLKTCVHIQLERKKSKGMDDKERETQNTGVLVEDIPVEGVQSLDNTVLVRPVEEEEWSYLQSMTNGEIWQAVREPEMEWKRLF